MRNKKEKREGHEKRVRELTDKRKPRRMGRIKWVHVIHEFKHSGNRHANDITNQRSYVCNRYYSLLWSVIEQWFPQEKGICRICIDCANVCVYVDCQQPRQRQRQKQQQ